MIKSFTRLLSVMMIASFMFFGFKANALSGSYTIGGTGASYATFADAVSALNTYGVTGAVTFTVAAGTYNESVTLNAISGASATNTITFDGVDYTTRKLTYSGSSSTDRAVIIFSGSQYVTFKNLYIESTGSWNMGVFFTANAQYNSIIGCKVVLPSVTGSYNYPYPVIFQSTSSISSYGYGTNASNNLIKNNICSGGFAAIYWYGGSSTTSLDNTGNKFIGNTFEDIYYYGAYFQRQGSYEFSNNKFTKFNYDYAMAFYGQYNQNGIIDGNFFRYGYQGLYIYYENYYGGTGSKINNNMVMDGRLSSYQYPFSLWYCNYLDVYHNSVWAKHSGSYWGYSTMSFYYCNYPKIKNNILVNENPNSCLAIYYGTITSGDIDYNNYYAISGTVGFYNGTTYSTLSAFQSGMSGHNTNSVSQAPHFTNYSDLHYSTGTTPKFVPYISSVAYDIDNDARGTTNTMQGADENIFPPYDLDITGILAPIVPTVGNNTVKIGLVNGGANALTAQTVKVGYAVNGGSWVVEDFKITSTWQPYTSAQYFTFTTPWYIPSAGTYDLCVRIFPQIANDGDAKDEMCYSACTGLKGNYTIDIAGGGNYTDIQTAINAMATCGISGPVNIIVKAGTYPAFTIPVIKGTSSVNTVTISGVDKAKVIIQHSGGTAYNSVNKANVNFTGADWVILENMTLNNSNTANGEGIHLINKSDHNIIRNIDINLDKAFSSYLIGIVGNGSLADYYTGGEWGEFNLFTHIKIIGGYFGVCTYNGNRNTFEHFDLQGSCYYGFYLQYPKGFRLQYNKVHKMADYPYASGVFYSYGIYTYQGTQDTIISNDIQPGRYGMYIYYENYNMTSSHSVYANNMVHNFRDAAYQVGIYMNYYCYNSHVVSNTVWVDGTIGTNYNYAALVAYYNYYCEYKNNILISSNNALCAAFYYPYYSSNDYNAYIHTGSSTYYFSYNGAYYDFTTFKNYNPSSTYLDVHDQNSRWQIDHQLISMADMHLRKGASGYIGTAVSNPVDFDGDPRCQLISFLGADEPVWKTAVNDFIADDTMCRYTPLTFYNTGIESDPHVTGWYLNGTYMTNSFHFAQSFPNKGTFTVRLVQQTCAGTDTITKKILIDDPKKAPKGDFMATKNVVEIGEQIYFNDMSKDCPAGWKWEISPATVYDAFTKQFEPSYTLLNGTTLTSNRPAMKFNYSGSYDISLTVDNSVGTGTKHTKVSYINVKFSDILCAAQNETSSLYGVLYDNGGASNYAPSKKCTYLIKPCAKDVKLVFSELNLAVGTYLRLYDGGSERGIPLWDPAYGKKGITGTIADKLFDTTYYANNSGMIYVEFESDIAVSSGFKFEWQSTGKGNYTKPVAKFVSEDTGCIVSPFAYENVSFADPAFTSYKWDYDGNGSVDAKTVHGSFVTSFPGLAATYKTTLIAENCGGIDTFTKLIVLINPQSTPFGDFSADITAPVMDQDIATFSVNAYRLSCVDKFEWRITPTTWYFENGTTKYSAHPQVVFQDTGCYDVSVIMGNTNSSFSTTKTKTCYIRPKQYCVPTVLTLHSDMGIGRVRLANIDHSSEIGVLGYTSYVNVAQTSLIMGQTYDIIVDRKSNFNKIAIGVWIDYNKDGDFYDAGELVASIGSSSGASWKGSFTVPTTVALGASVVRIGVNYAGYANDPCGPNNFGEVEDYRIFISPDNIAPVITITGNNPYSIEQGYTYTDEGAVAVDNIMGNITNTSFHGMPLFTTSGSVNTKIVGAYYITYSACDTIPNCAADARRQVNVTPDQTPPVITLIGGDPLYVNVNVPFIDTFFTAIDLADGDITNKVQVSGNLNVYQLGTYTRTYFVSDKAGFTDTKTRTLIVQDYATPDISLNGANPMYVEIMTPYKEAGATYSDNYWPNNKIAYSVTGIVDTTKSGSYSVYYSVTDYSGNGPKTVVRTVIVWDSIAPTLTAKGGDVIEHEVNTPFIDPGLEIKDNSLSGFTTSRWGSFLTNFPDEIPDKVGNYIIFYTVTDASGNKSEIFGRVVRVIDSHAPVLSLLGSPYVIYERWAAVTEDGYSVSDNYYKNSELTIDTVNDVTTMLEGVYHVCYTASDPSGNVSNSVCRLVRVVYNNVGIDENSSAGISVYPNPSSGLFTAETTGLKGQEVRISVLNQIGQEVMEIHRGMINQDQYEIDLSNYADGVYLLRVQTASNSFTKQMILTK